MSGKDQEVVETQPKPSPKTDDKFKSSPGASTSDLPVAGIFDTPNMTSTPKKSIPDTTDSDLSIQMNIDFQKWKFEQELDERKQQRQHEILMLERKAQIDQDMYEQERHAKEQEYQKMHEFQLEKEKRKAFSGLTINPMTDDSKIDTFFDNFEKMATTCGWDEATWVVRLAPCLRGQAADAYRELDPKHGTDYGTWNRLPGSQKSNIE